jgi:hypothetical protein
MDLYIKAIEVCKWHFENMYEVMFSTLVLLMSNRWAFHDIILPSLILLLHCLDSPVVLSENEPLYVNSLWVWVGTQSYHKQNPCNQFNSSALFTKLQVWMLAASDMKVRTVLCLASCSRSSSKCYLRIQSVPQREHHTSPLQRSTG